MYTLIDPKSFWPQMSIPSMPSNQIFMAPVPATPTYLMGGTQVVPMPHQSPPMYYSFQPTWYPQHCVPTMTPSTRPRMSSDDVFVFDNTPHLNVPYPYIESLPKPRQRVAGTVDDMSLELSSPKDNSRVRRHSGTNSESSVHSSPQSDGGFSGSSSRSSASNHTDSNSIESLNQSLVSTSHKETANLNLDHSLYNVFSSSLYCALNRDPPEPAGGNRAIPLKTSSPIRNEKKCLNQRQIPMVESGSEDNSNQLQTNWSPTHSENSEAQAFSPEDGNLPAGQGGNRRQKFLRALEEERERQRCLVLPKHAPKMNCKFCKNNGENAEVYTKHRLHFKEKTVCPLLRLYVCRLCNSTGDFAHTIKHCPFNARFDKVAWKATFL